MLIQDDGQGRDESEGRRSTGEQRRRGAAVSADGRARLLVSMLVEWVAGGRARSRKGYARELHYHREREGWVVDSWKGAWRAFCAIPSADASAAVTPTT